MLLPLALDGFREWLRQKGHALRNDKVVVVTLPEPMLVSAMERGGIAFGAAVVPVDWTDGLWPDVVIMVTAMFVFSAAMVRTGAVEMIGVRRDVVPSPSLATTGRELCDLFFSGRAEVVPNTCPIDPLATNASCRSQYCSSPPHFRCSSMRLGGQWTLIGTRSNIIVSDFTPPPNGSGN